MDEFGVLTERFGLKQQGKAAPMASSKASQNRVFGSNSTDNSKPGLSSTPYGGSFSVDPEDLFNTRKNQSSNASSDLLDVFAGFNKNSSSSFKDDLMFSNTGFSSGKTSIDDDLFGGFSRSNSASNTIGDDIFGSFGSNNSSSTNNHKKQNGGVAIDDLLGNSRAIPSGNDSFGFGLDDDLLSGFGPTSTRNQGKNTGTAKTATSSVDDPFFVLESISTSSKSTFVDPLEEFGQFNQSSNKNPATSSDAFSSTLKPPPKPGQVLKTNKAHNLGASPIDELENFASGRIRRNSDNHSDSREVRETQSAKGRKHKEAGEIKWQSQENSMDDLDFIFGMGSRSSSVPKSRTPTLDPLFDSNKKDGGKSNVIHKASSGIKKASSTTNFVDDLSFAFGGAQMFGEFEEVDDESEERRRARLGRHQRTQDRVARAVADMNQRDLQTQHEQEERSRIADSMDIEIKRWAAGKDGNMRALLSSLQHVLWPECGWEPVSLTDLITSTSVKKVYRKATLCVHPDKVQQKGATLQQKYTAEKVFDILKEAWIKFSKEELS